MNYEQLSALAMDSQDFLCYMSDIKTYELLYLNKPIRDGFGIDDGYVGKPCYKLLQNKDEPCEFCNNSKLCLGEKITWEIQNNVTKDYYSLIDTLVKVGDRDVRLEIAFNTSSHYEKVESLTKRLSIGETLIRCIQTLVEHIDIEDAINSLLSTIGEYYKSDRAYIFEFDKKHTFADNTYEWCSEGVVPVKDTLQDVPAEHLSPWTDEFQKSGEIIIKDLDADLDHSSGLYGVLKPQDISSLLVVPLRSKDKVLGFIGVDNPKRALQDLTLLHSISLFVVDDLRKKRMRMQLEFLSYTDILTGLYNRNKYMEKIQDLELDPPKSIGVAYVDINGLRKLNETYGHSYGDSVIKKTADILKIYFTNNIYRAGGDEFIILCPDIDKETFEAKIQSIRNCSGQEDNCTYSVGSVWQSGKIDVLRNIYNSDEIMYAEKQHFYKNYVSGRISRRSDSAVEVLKEIEEGLFSAYLQPKVDILTGEIVSAEALIRKFDKNGGIISPIKFIPIYEHEGTIRHVDYFILESVCKYLKHLLEIGKPLKIAVNFSRVTFMEYELVDEISKICEKYAIPHKYIVIEITESIDKLDSEFFVKKLNALSDAGFSVSLDDFGSKYSNLVMLASNSFSEVKLDKALVDNICELPKHRLVVKSIVKLINALGGCDSLAEGVETKEQRDILIECGCKYAQGYLFYRPMPWANFLTEYLK